MFEWRLAPHDEPQFAIASFQTAVSAALKIKTAARCSWCAIHYILAKQRLAKFQRLSESCIGISAALPNAENLPLRLRQKPVPPMTLSPTISNWNQRPRWATSYLFTPLYLVSLHLTYVASFSNSSATHGVSQKKFCDSNDLLGEWSFGKCDLCLVMF